MRKDMVRRFIGLAASAAVITRPAVQMPVNVSKAQELINYNNALVASQGTNADNAVIKGSQAAVVHDSYLDSDVLDLHGSGFGEGWLKLPDMFSDGCGNGFTFSLKYKLDSGIEKYTRLFQFSPIPFGGGTEPSYSSPDISVDLKDLKNFRTSIFVGTDISASGDGKHKAIFDLDAVPDSGKWHEMTAVYSPENAQIYIDGKGLGVSGVKVDYYESDTQQTMKQMNLCAKIAAENKLMVLFHGCTLPRGESRTYPNIVSYEAVNGTEYYKWFQSPALANRVSYTFTRNVVGSADFTPTGIPVMGIKATAGFALADVVTIESGIQHFAHSVFTYQGNSALPFLNDVPVVWDDMKVLDGYPMQFNVTARRSGDDWYIGASTLDARTVDIKLSDLISGDEKYKAYIFADNKDGSKVEVTVLEDLTEDSVISRDLLPNGGFAMKLTKGTMALTTPYSNYRFYEAENAKMSGKARVQKDKAAKYSSGNAYVEYIGGWGNDLTFENVMADKAGEYTLRIYYVSGERRNLSVDVNGQNMAKLSGLYANRNDWSGIAAVDTKVTLKEGSNTIKLYNDGNAPNIDRIAIAIPYEDIKGDVDLNGKFELADVVLMQKYLLGRCGLEGWKNGDVAEDGSLDVIDLIVMKKMLLQK